MESKKRTRDINGIKDKVLSIHAKGLSQHDITKIIEDIYVFSISHETISEINDRALDVASE